MLEIDKNDFDKSDTITRQPFRLSKKWKKKWTPNTDLMDNHLINHNLANHNLNKTSVDDIINVEPKKENVSISESISIETSPDFNKNDEKKNQAFKNSFKPSCPGFEAKDCPFSCCVFLCLLAGHGVSSKKKKEKKRSKKMLKHSMNSIQSFSNTTASTIQEDDIYESNITRASSHSNLNNQLNQSSNENINKINETDEKKLSKNTEV